MIDEVGLGKAILDHISHNVYPSRDISLDHRGNLLMEPAQSVYTPFRQEGPPPFPPKVGEWRLQDVRASVGEISSERRTATYEFAGEFLSITTEAHPDLVQLFFGKQGCGCGGGHGH